MYRNRKSSSYRRAFQIVGSGLLFAGATHADPWTVQSPTPADHSLHMAAFISDEVGFCVGADQIFVRTTDGGATWNQIPEVARDPLFLQDPFNNIFFLDDRIHGWVIGNNNLAWRTSNGGQSWTRMTDHPAGSYYHMEFMTPSLGWTAGNGSVCRTVDGGVTWDVLTWYDEHGVVYGMDFLNASVGAMVTDPLSFSTYEEGIYITSDAGDTWTHLRNGIYNDVALLSTSTIIAAAPSEISRSTDGGNTWTTVASDQVDGFADLEVVDADTIVATGIDGGVWVSDDAGQTWERTHDGVGTLPDVWGVRFTDSQFGQLAGPGGWLFETRDGGHSWTQINNGLAVIWSDIEMFDDFRGVAGGGQGIITWTKDGGHTWKTQVLEVTGQLFGRSESIESVDYVDRDFVAAGGNGGIVFTSEDGGETWTSIGYPAIPDTYIHKVDFVSRDVGWVVGQDAATLGGAIYKTTNGGLTWQSQGTGFGAVYGADFADENTGWITGGSSLIFKTTDGGQTWVPYEFPFTFSTSATDVAFARDDPDVGYILQALGDVKKTSDGGITWSIQPLPGLDDREWPVDVEVVSRDEAWIVTGIGKTYHTTNGGTTWTQIINGHTEPWWNSLSAISVTPAGRVWSAGFPGFILANDPPASGFVLEQSALVRGQIASFIVRNADPSERAYILYSFAGVGEGPSVPALGGLQLDVLAPVRQAGSAIADATGVAVFRARVPADAPLIDVHSQAVIRRGDEGERSIKSNTVTDQIRP